jgi:hypothetical protein
MLALTPATALLSIVSWAPAPMLTLFRLNSARLTPFGKPAVGQFIGGVPKEILPFRHSPAGGVYLIESPLLIVNEP